MYFDFGPCAECVDALHSNSVKSAGNFVCVIVELSTRMKFSQYDFDSGAAIDFLIVALHRIDGHSASVVHNGAGSIDTQAHENLRCKAGHRFVDGVVDTLINKVVQGAEPSSTDIHSWTFADCLKTFQNLDIFGGITTFGFGVRAHNFKYFPEKTIVIILPEPYPKR